MGRPVPMSLLFRRSEGNYISGCLPGKYLIWVVRWSYWLLDAVSGAGERGAAFDWVFRGGRTLAKVKGSRSADLCKFALFASAIREQHSAFFSLDVRLLFA
jgi:hypothetical protein